MRCWFIILALSFCQTALAAERWVYAPVNLQVDAEAERITGLLRRSKAMGYTHLLITDSKFSRVPSLQERYFRNVERIATAADELGIILVPALFGIGYSNDLLSNNPNLAEGLPVRDALFVVKDDIASHVPEPMVQLADTRFKDRRRWAFMDDTLQSEAGVLTSGPTAENARFSQKLALSPFRQYHLRVEIRTQDLSGGKPEIKVLAGRQQLQLTSLKVAPTQDWTSYDVTFNSLSHPSPQLYIGVWGGHGGTISYRHPALDEVGLVNVLRRPGTPLVVRTEEGTTLVEGRDYERLVDENLGRVPYAGEYAAFSDPLTLQMKSFEDGARLRVSYFHPHMIYDGQVCICVSEPETKRLLERQVMDLQRLWRSGDRMMNHDEWRVLNWCHACTSRSLTPGQIAAENVRYCQSLLKRVHPTGRIFVWSDMFDPHHNAVPGPYYLVNGSLTDSWLGLAKETTIVNWNRGKAAESLGFFAERGHAQLIAAFYDAPLEQTSAWLQQVKNMPNILGFMYTTWRQDYSQLEAFAELLDASGF
jgi:hypothetical protein